MFYLAAAAVVAALGPFMLRLQTFAHSLRQ